MKFPQEFIERVLEANNLVDIIGSLTPLKASGKNLMGRCPFPDHKEKTASFSVSEHKQLYHCFGCKKSGNLLTFLEAYHGMSFPEAIEYLAHRASISLPAPPPISGRGDGQGGNNMSGDQYKDHNRDQSRDHKKNLYKVNKLAAQYFHSNLMGMSRTSAVWKYIESRRLAPSTIEKFQIGVALDEWEGLTRFLTQKNIPTAIAKEAGLIKAREGKPGFYDLFRHRLMFPIYSILGEVVGFGGRVLDDSQPKYLNSPESVVFHKGKNFYGVSEAAKYIRASDQAIVVEGYMDQISLFQAGVTNVIATLGTALTPDHAKALKRLTKNVVVLFDGDAAGKSAAERSLPILLENGLIPKGLTLSDELDPDEFVIEKGSEELKKLLDSCPELFHVILYRWLEGYRSEAGQKLALVDKLAPLLGGISDVRLTSLYLKEAANLLGVPEAWLKQALLETQKKSPALKKEVQPSKAPPSAQSFAQTSDANKSAQTAESVAMPLGQPGTPQTVSVGWGEIPSPIEKISLAKAHPAELALLRLAFAKYEVLCKIQAEVHFPDFILHPGVKKILCKIVEETRQQPERFVTVISLLASYIENPNDIFVEEEGYRVGEEDQLYSDCIRRLMDRYFQFQARELAKKGLTSEENLEKIMRLHRDRHQITSSKG